MSSHFTQLNQNDEATNDEKFTDIYSYIAYNTRWTERCNYHTANSTDKCLTATGTVIIDVE